MRAPAVAALAALLLVAGASRADVAGGTGDAIAQAGAAAARLAARYDAQADAATDAAARARWQRLAVAARVDGATAETAAADRRRATIARALAMQNARLAADEAPVARLLAALGMLARQPALAMLARPGSIDDLVHVQAVLDAAVPALRHRTAALREELGRTRALQDSAAAAARRLADGRGRLIEARAQLAALDDGSGDAGGEDGGAIERALALGEEARETSAQLRSIGGQQGVLQDVIALPGPPVGGVARGGTVPGVYRLPVAGRLLTGLGELSDNGVRARGLSFAVAEGAAVTAPAAGRVVFARAFRRYGMIVILDHGAGWTTLLTGMARLSVTAGRTVAAGARLGRAGAAPVTVELRRRGQPMDVAQLAD
jgi:septal ring factor EnvC (AmiA/AmiB activator)